MQPGDTLSGIADRLRTTVDNLTGYRSGNRNIIYPGERITIKTQPKFQLDESVINNPPQIQTPSTGNRLLDGVRRMLGGTTADTFSESPADYRTPTQRTDHPGTRPDLLPQNRTADPFRQNVPTPTGDQHPGTRPDLLPQNRTADPFGQNAPAQNYQDNFRRYQPQTTPATDLPGQNYQDNFWRTQNTPPREPTPYEQALTGETTARTNLLQQILNRGTDQTPTAPTIPTRQPTDTSSLTSRAENLRNELTGGDLSTQLEQQRKERDRAMKDLDNFRTDRYDRLTRDRDVEKNRTAISNLDKQIQRAREQRDSDVLVARGNPGISAANLTGEIAAIRDAHNAKINNLIQDRNARSERYNNTLSEIDDIINREVADREQQLGYHQGLVSETQGRFDDYRNYIRDELSGIRDRLYDVQDSDSDFMRDLERLRYQSEQDRLLAEIDNKAALERALLGGSSGSSALEKIATNPLTGEMYSYSPRDIQGTFEHIDTSTGGFDPRLGLSSGMPQKQQLSWWDRFKNFFIR